MQKPAQARIQPMRALRALGRLLRDPNDTEQVFEIIGALGARAMRRKVADLEQTQQGRALLSDRPSLMAALATSRAEDFAPDTLGAHYHAFLRREGITTDGLVAVSTASTERLADDTLYLSERGTQQHDLWHILTGYQGDIVGEMALLAFSAPQTRNPGIMLIATTLYVVVAGRLGVRALMREAYRRGKRAVDLQQVRWEDELHAPLPALRSALNVDAPPQYLQVRAEDLGPKGLLGPMPTA